RLSARRVVVVLHADGHPQREPDRHPPGQQQLRDVLTGEVGGEQVRRSGAGASSYGGSDRDELTVAGMVETLLGPPDADRAVGTGADSGDVRTPVSAARCTRAAAAGGSPRPSHSVMTGGVVSRRRAG